MEIRGGDRPGSDSRAKENRGGRWRPRREFFQALPGRLLRLLSVWLRSGLLWRCFLFLGFPAANQRQGIRGVEGELANRGLARRAQSNVDPAIARHLDRHYVPENLLPLF